MPRTPRRSRLLNRVIQRRRAEGAAGAPVDERGGDPERRLTSLENRIEHLEALVEGLQDAVYRDTVRHDREIKDLAEKTNPGEMSKSLSRHAREHGL
jgi:uncharacterized coiled-coil protein SlyX